MRYSIYSGSAVGVLNISHQNELCHIFHKILFMPLELRYVLNLEEIMKKTTLTRGERFKDARRIYNQHGDQTMEQVHKATGVYASLIKDLEADSERDCGYLKIAKLAKHYGVSIDWLLGFVENPTSDQSLQGVCKFTGLSPSSAELLHADNSSTGFTTCLVDAVLHAAGICDNEMAEAIDDSALALATSLVGNAAFDETKCEVKNKSAVIRRNGKSEYSITAEAAADWFLMKATDLAKSNVDDAVRKMRDNYVVALVNPQRSDDTPFEFVFTTADESEIE